MHSHIHSIFFSVIIELEIKKMLLGRAKEENLLNGHYKY